MKRAFLDTNILIDLIADRKPFSNFAIAIFKKAEENKIELFTSSISIVNTHYILKKYLNEKKPREILYSLFDFLQIIPIDINILKKGLKSRHRDFEDAVQIISANSIRDIECIVTRNKRDFQFSEIPVFAPDELIGSL
jgi:predicted nucleic acid-binding protein